PGSRDRHEREMTRQLETPVHFPPDRRVTLSALAEWTRWGVEEVGAKVVVVDHFHRMDLRSPTDFRVQVTDAIRAMKDLARQYRVALVATSQLNDDGDPFDRYFPPLLRRLKESR